MKIPDCHQHVCECAGRPTLYVCASACVCKCVKLATDEFSMCANVCSFVRVCVCVCARMCGCKRATNDVFLCTCNGHIVCPSPGPACPSPGPAPPTKKTFATDISHVHFRGLEHPKKTIATDITMFACMLVCVFDIPESHRNGPQISWSVLDETIPDFEKLTKT